MLYVDPTSDLYCPQCGYNLQGIESERCPECGIEVDREQIRRQTFPWHRRRLIGPYRAFLSTVHRVTFYPERLGEEMTFTVRFPDAVRFRRCVVAHVWIPAGVVVSNIYLESLEGWSYLNGLWVPTDVPGSLIQLLNLLGLWICLLLFLMGATGVASYFFHPRTLSVKLQNKAIALSYYTCAPWTYTIGTLALAWMGWRTTIGSWMPDLIERLLCFLGFVPLIIQLMLMVRVPVVALRVTTGSSWARRARFAVYLPLAWGLLGFIVLIIVPLAWLRLMSLILSVLP